MIDGEEVRAAQEAVRDVYADRLVKEYVVALVNATRTHESIYLGASPRASLGILGLAQARALLDGRDFVEPDDVKAVAPPVLGHRLVLSSDGRGSMSEDETVSAILDTVPVPGATAVQV